MKIMSIFWRKLSQTMVGKMKISLVGKYKCTQAERIEMGAIGNLF